MQTKTLTRRALFTAPADGAASLPRRDFIGAGLALGAGAALSTSASAQTAGGQLTCHMLDTYDGRPGGGLRVDLSKLVGGAWTLVKSAITVDSGRTAEPLMSGDGMQTGQFMLEFFHADYFKTRAYLPSTPFFDRVTHFLEVPKTTTRYHITLVASPWGYTTYRWKE